MVQGGATWCKMVQHGARWCKIVQDNARQRKIVQDSARQCRIVQDSAGQCKIVQADYAHYAECAEYAEQFTADGAYLCPVGSIWLFFTSQSSWPALARASLDLFLLCSTTVCLVIMQMGGCTLLHQFLFSPQSPIHQQTHNKQTQTNKSETFPKHFREPRSAIECL